MYINRERGGEGNYNSWRFLTLPAVFTAGAELALMSSPTHCPCPMDTASFCRMGCGEEGAGRGRRSVVLGHPLRTVAGQTLTRRAWGDVLLGLVGHSAGDPQQVGPAQRISHHLLAGAVLPTEQGTAPSSSSASQSSPSCLLFLSLSVWSRLHQQWIQPPN
jgi:hypothetical protein